jgi:hypothetical protein
MDALKVSGARVTDDGSGIDIGSVNHDNGAELAGLHYKLFVIMADLRHVADHLERYENADCVGLNIGTYAEPDWDQGPWND